MSTIREVLAPFVTQEVAGAEPPDWAAIEAALQEREDVIRDNLSMIAMRLGTFPEFVAESFAEVGLGTPPSEEGRALLKQQFANRAAWLQEQFNQRPPEGQ